MTTQLEINRKKAIEMLLPEADKYNPTLFDYHLDDYVRELYDLPSRPEGQEPYQGWMVGEKESETPQLKISREGISFIKRWEGCRLKAYQCSARVWTIGWGHTKTVKSGMVITQARANELLAEDLIEYDQAVINFVKVNLTQNQRDALVSFCFNVGIGAFHKSTLLRVLNQGNYSEAANQFMRWNRAGGKIVQGLNNRREAERKLFLS